MPVRAPRVCGLCGGVHHDGERCPKAKAQDRERKARFDAKRPCARTRGYTRTWQAESKAFLREHPFCAMCGEPASVVDHKKPHKGDMALFWDRNNWQPLCAHHHNSTKQALERKQ